MRMWTRFLVIACLLSGTTFAQPEAKPRPGNRNEYPPKLSGAKVAVYKSVGDVKLNLYIYEPHDHDPSHKRAAIVFFFGGGWRSGTPKQFEQHCRHLAERGMVAMTADYRVSSRHGTKAVQCVEDAKSAVRWIRIHADELGIDPKRIAAGGGSAGGHLAACTGVIEEFDSSGESNKISSRPDALALFNPAVVLAPIDGKLPLDKERMDGLRERMGVAPERLSPYHHVQAKQPPTIIFHGKADATVPFFTVEEFSKRMRQVGNKCELVGYENQGHGFFNFGRSNSSAYRDTLKKLDAFLIAQGFLDDSAAN